MIGFVLSGGGNRGAIEAGGLVALLENGIVPDLLVGASAGALNSTFLACRPNLDGAFALTNVWRKAKASDLFPDNLLTQAFRFISGADSLRTNQGLRAFVEANKPPDKNVFGDLSVKLYLTTGSLETGLIYLYGDDPSASLVEAALASSALPGVFPPIVHGGQQFVDGAVVANVPISIAMDKGATTIYVLNLWYAGIRPPSHGVINVLRRSVDVMENQQLQYDLRRAAEDTSVAVHHIYMGDLFDGVALEDFSQMDAMITAGHQRTLDYLNQPSPLVRGTEAPRPAEAPPPGAHLYTPHF